MIFLLLVYLDHLLLKKFITRAELQGSQHSKVPKGLVRKSTRARSQVSYIPGRLAWTMLHLPTHFFMLWIWTIIVKFDILVLKRIYSLEQDLDGLVEQHDRTWSKKINMGIRRNRACLKWVLFENRDFGRTEALWGWTDWKAATIGLNLT